MTPDEIDAILNVWGEIYVKNLRKVLSQKTFTYAPGFKGSAYGLGRNTEYAGQNDKIASGSLYKSINYNVQNQFLEIYMAPHWKYVNFGVQAKGYKKRKSGGGGKSEFISALVDWSKTRLGLSGQNALSFAFAARINIFKFGIAPTNFIDKGAQEALKEARGVLPAYIVDYIKKEFGL